MRDFSRQREAAARAKVEGKLHEPDPNALHVSEYLRGEHTFWPWLRSHPALEELRAAIKLEKAREAPRLRILRRMQNEVRKMENDKLLGK